MHNSKPNASLTHGAGSYYPATRITIQTSSGRYRDSRVLYETIVPESCMLVGESTYWRFHDIENGRDDATREILRIPEITRLVEGMPDLALVVQYGCVYAGTGFIQHLDYVSYDSLSPSRIKELRGEDWEDC
ncbi:hypothetical protein [Bifidobacterium pseudolongum]|uniref:hypothetical protein n=1 Tax=Bifidobacterium pseudolongum TaxID=1694 RepID=UPI0020A0E612|nr:hypothetical protein [Bifidobacterium pseudolongum]